MVLLIRGIHSLVNKSCKRRKSKVSQTSRRNYLVHPFIGLLLVIALFSITSSMIKTDPSIEFNPGPYTGNKIVFNSNEEKKLFKSSRSCNNDIARISSHRQYLTRCKQLELVPRDFEQKISLATAKANEGFLEKINKISNANSTHIMQTIIDHYNHQIPLILKNRDQYRNDLRDIANNEQYIYLCSILQKIADSDIEYFRKNKEKKLNTLLEINSRSSEEIWLPHLNLGFTEIQLVTNNDQICDAIVNAAMILICKETPRLNIQSTTLPASMLTFSPVKTIHIHHNSKGHFVTSSSLTK